MEFRIGATLMVLGLALGFWPGTARAETSRVELVTFDGHRYLYSFELDAREARTLEVSAESLQKLITRAKREHARRVLHYADYMGVDAYKVIPGLRVRRITLERGTQIITLRGPVPGQNARRLRSSLP